MKTQACRSRVIVVALLLLSAVIYQPSTLHAQGALTPPGAPAPTMKTADQIYAKLDPRIPVSTNTTPGDGLANEFIISQPGSYYLTTNIVGIASENGIEILANNVTLDLNGFTLQGKSVGISGVIIPNGCTNVTVRNGNITGWEFVGVYGPSTSSKNLLLTGLGVSDNEEGITIGTGEVRDCRCEDNSSGIICNGFGVVSGCTAINNIFDENSYGISIFSGSVSACSANNNGNGISISSGTVSGCYVCSNNYFGILAQNASQVIGNTLIGNNTFNETGDAGIYIYGSNDRVENNHVTSSGRSGIYVDYGSTGNVIIKNSVYGNGANNYEILGSPNVLGPIVNDSSGNIINSSPWGNFSF